MKENPGKKPDNFSIAAAIKLRGTGHSKWLTGEVAKKPSVNQKTALKRQVNTIPKTRRIKKSG
jgi:hypothetical protein